MEAVVTFLRRLRYLPALLRAYFAGGTIITNAYIYGSFHIKYSGRRCILNSTFHWDTAD